MKFLWTSVLIIIAFQAQSQDDFFSDARRKNEGFERLRHRDIRADVATFTLSGIGESAAALRLPKIPVSTVGKDSVTFEGDGIYAKVKIAPFDKDAHKLTYDDKYLVRIDRRAYYGNYTKIPKTTISEVLLILDEDTVPLPPIAYQDLHNLNFTYEDKGVQRTRDAVYRSSDGQKIYLYLFSKDNTGSYEVTWVFLDKKYFRRVLDYGFM